MSKVMKLFLALELSSKEMWGEIVVNEIIINLVDSVVIVLIAGT